MFRAVLDALFRFLDGLTCLTEAPHSKWDMPIAMVAAQLTHSFDATFTLLILPDDRNGDDLEGDERTGAPGVVISVARHRIASVAIHDRIPRGPNSRYLALIISPAISTRSNVTAFGILGIALINRCKYNIMEGRWLEIARPRHSISQAST